MNQPYSRTTLAIGFLGAVWLSGCAARSIRVESDPPGAEISVYNPGQAPRKLGTSPALVSSSDFADRSQPWIISLSKEGFGSEAFIVPPSAIGYAGSINAQLKAIELPASCQNQVISLNRVARAVAESQAFLRSKDFGAAEKVLIEMAAQYPGVSVLHDLLGNVYYLQRDVEKALASYRRSLAISPGNLETSRMIKKLSEMRGGATR